ncbi:hypothetical protein [Asinibacterium sp. OR53]|uniref:hypothetical protein n=1 Tax=Asinibacterium sp. OR53 TaxID=925409 RepID=UPI00047B3A52|nr:hypothetical protein [Asinibacterium sp. OR53]
MRKILIAFYGTNYSDSALSFAAKLNEKNPILIAGAFLPQTSIANLWMYFGTGASGQEFLSQIRDNDKEVIQKNINRFEYFCIDHGIEYRIHKDYLDFAIPELIKESRFADLLIICSESFYWDIKNEPNEYLEETLHAIECPVILLPNEFEFPSCNILAYDGGKSSVYAIKQFSYLLPELTSNETTLICADDSINIPLPDELNVGELTARHFDNLNLLKFESDPKKYFNTWLSEKKGAILVSGSFGRSALYRLFHKSFIAETVKEHQTPVFIAHK